MITPLQIACLVFCVGFGVIVGWLVYVWREARHHR